MGAISLDISLTAFSFFIAIIKLTARCHIWSPHAQFSVFMHNFHQTHVQFVKEI